jgi:EAL domain-containing protein (putative c-di-GMP-specific phosphodiesterase class I)
VPILGFGFECHVGASVGAAAQTEPSNEIRQLLVNADIALYEAKKLGRNRVEFFSETLRLAAANAKRTADELLSAIERDELVPYFQPQFCAETLEVVGVEALARWRHPTRGVLTPDRFLAVAEGLNRVSDIDAIILEKSLFEATRWATNQLDVKKVSVNISAQRLQEPRLIERLSQLRIPAGSLSFELLESISFDGQDDDLVGAIQKIKSFGVDIEIDDFGTGHASIISLIELAPRRLKIDRKLIAPIVSSKTQQRLVASIIEIGKSMGIEIIAEGVETMAHAHVLRELGCTTLQGYAFAKPMPSEALMAFLQARAVSQREPSPIAACA